MLPITCSASTYLTHKSNVVHENRLLAGCLTYYVFSPNSESSNTQIVATIVDLHQPRKGGDGSPLGCLLQMLSNRILPHMHPHTI